MQFRSIETNNKQKMPENVVSIRSSLGFDRLNPSFGATQPPQTLKCRVARTLVIVIGRDELSWTTDWDKFNHCKINSIGLDVLDEEDARSLLNAMDIYDEERINEILEKSYRLPLLLEVLGQAYASGQQSRWIENYFQRITYQMTEKQKEWLQALCFLDVRVDEDTITKMLPDVDARHVLDWFKSEASARISTRDGWQVDPIVKTIIRDKVSQESNRRKRDYIKKAEVAQQEYLRWYSEKD